MKCAVDNCKNESWRGKFDGNLCSPCHMYLTELLEVKGYSQALTNMQEAAKYYLKLSEYYKIDEKYK